MKNSILRSSSNISKYGFTLIELIAAFVILSITLVGMASFYFANHKNLLWATRERLATWKAIDKMEELKVVNYETLETLPEENFTLYRVPAKRKVEIEEIDEDSDGSTDYKKVTVKITWEQKETVLITYISPR